MACCGLELGSLWGRGGGIEVEGAVEGFPGREEGSDGGLAEKVEGELGLREEFVSQVI